MTSPPPNSPSSKDRLAPGLYFVATPIGAARDITLRALDILRDCDMIAAEDTRSLRHLLAIHGIALNGRRVLAYHDHNGAAARPAILAHLDAGKSVAYASEAGTPLVADPGYALGRAAIEAGHVVTTAPGASAVLAALTVSGLPTDRFFFAGFAPSKSGERRRWLGTLAAIDATLILYESPKRIQESLRDICDCLGKDRKIALCRELTKRFEEVIRGDIDSLRAQIADRDVKGEIVLVIDRASTPAAPPQEEVEEALKELLKTLHLKDAAAILADRFGLPKRDIYNRGLALAKISATDPKAKDRPQPKDRRWE